MSRRRHRSGTGRPGPLPGRASRAPVAGRREVLEDLRAEHVDAAVGQVGEGFGRVGLLLEALDAAVGAGDRNPELGGVLDPLGGQGRDPVVGLVEGAHRAQVEVGVEPADDAALLELVEPCLHGAARDAELAGQLHDTGARDVAQRPDQAGVERVDPPCGEDQPRAPGRQAVCRRPTDAARRPGDHDHGALELEERPTHRHREVEDLVTATAPP